MTIIYKDEHGERDQLCACDFCRASSFLVIIKTNKDHSRFVISLLIFLIGHDYVVRAMSCLSRYLKISDARQKIFIPKFIALPPIASLIAENCPLQLGKHVSSMHNAQKLPLSRS